MVIRTPFALPGVALLLLSGIAFMSVARATEEDARLQQDVSPLLFAEEIRYATLVIPQVLLVLDFARLAIHF